MMCCTFRISRILTYILLARQISYNQQNPTAIHLCKLLVLQIQGVIVCKTRKFHMNINVASHWRIERLHTVAQWWWSICCFMKSLRLCQSQNCTKWCPFQCYICLQMATVGEYMHLWFEYIAFVKILFYHFREDNNQNHTSYIVHES